MPKTKMRGRTTIKDGKSGAGYGSKSLGTRLRDLRVQRKMSQGEIEKRTGLLRCYVSRVEGGYTVPSVVTLEKFAAALAMPLHAIFMRGKDSALRPISVARARKQAAPDPFTVKLRRLVGKMDTRDRDTFLSLVRKLAIRAA